MIRFSGFFVMESKIPRNTAKKEKGGRQRFTGIRVSKGS